MAASDASPTRLCRKTRAASATMSRPIAALATFRATPAKVTIPISSAIPTSAREASARRVNSPDCHAASAAQDVGPYAAGSQARPWNLVGEEKARFEGKVVDIVCELTGDCPEDCGAGRRQLGLLRDADGVLLIAAKNTQPAFTGAGLDLLPYCNEAVEVDGLIVGDPEESPTRIYQIQLIRRAGEAEFSKTNRWTKIWNENHPDLAKAKGPWFRKDPRVNARIAAEGYLGLGLETDEAFKAYLFE